MTPTTIERIELFGYRVTYRHGDYLMSGGRLVTELESTVVQVRTRGGTLGWGETCPLGTAYLPDFAAGVREAVRVLAPALTGMDLSQPLALRARMEAVLRGQRAAKSVLDVACWDALGRASGQSVAQLLGGRLQERLPLYVAVPMADPEAMAEFAAAHRAEGIHRFQLKLGGPPDLDVERTAAVVGATGPDDLILADANGGWRRQDAIRAAVGLESLERVLLEQPCPTLPECLAVRQVTSLPMVLDEVIVTLSDLTQAVALQAMDHLNLKLSRVGGLGPARLIRDAAVELGIRLTVEDTWGCDLTTAAVSQLAAGIPEEALFAVSYMNDWTEPHLCGHRPRSAGGYGPVLDRPGLGVDIDVERLGRPLFTWPET